MRLLPVWEGVLPGKVGQLGIQTPCLQGGACRLGEKAVFLFLGMHEGIRQRICSTGAEQKEEEECRKSIVVRIAVRH